MVRSRLGRELGQLVPRVGQKTCFCHESERSGEQVLEWRRGSYSPYRPRQRYEASAARVPRTDTSGMQLLWFAVAV